MDVPSRLRIGEWQAERATNELSRPGERLRIEPKAMEVLMVLAGRAGQVVGRDELLATVWTGVVVGDEALTQSIIKLRRALGDNPRSPAYIETISKRGYRLIAAVGEGNVAASRPAGWRPWAVAIVVLVSAGALATWHWASQPAPAEEPAPGGFLTVTVLPFETLGSRAEYGYLASGISSDLMTDLSALSGLRLISAGAGKGSARYLVSGSVQPEAGRLRINVRLTDSRTNQQLWSERFDRPMGDLFAIQNEISRRLSERLPAQISAAERERMAKRYTASLEAYDLFLRGQAAFLVRRAEDNRRARELYAKALELDPNFARAYAGLAMTYAMEYRYQRSADSDAALRRALELAESARLIDPGIPEVYWALGFVHTQSRRHDEALKALQKAIELNRSYADAYALMGGVHTYVGRPAESIALLRTALRLNPDGGYLYYLLLGRAYLFQNDIEQALINLREAHARNPENTETRVYLAAALAAQGSIPAAEWEAEEIRSREAGFSARAWLETYPLVSPPHQRRLAELLARAGLS
jgi:DNA-binding winged helix-turn-helix (wHTH) protein/TolB-like protein/Tfp pilus assembly protein PilF